MELDLWFDKTKKTWKSHLQDTHINRTLKDLDDYAFNPAQEKIKYNVNIINEDTFYQNKNNLIVYNIDPWILYDGCIKSSINEVINEETKIFAKEKNLKIILAHTKEYLPLWDLDDWYHKEYKFIDMSAMIDGLLAYGKDQMIKHSLNGLNISIPIGMYDTNCYRSALLIYLYQKDILKRNDVWYSLFYRKQIGKPTENDIINHYNYIKSKNLFKFDNHSIEEILNIFTFKSYNYFGELETDKYDVHDVDQYLVIPQILHSNLCVFVESYTEANELQFSAATEKTYKCIENKIPFLAFGPKNFYKKYELLGYKLHNYIDYSFDVIDNPDERFKAFLKEVSRLIKQDLHGCKLQDYDILLHNASVYNNKLLNSWKNINELLD